MRTWFCLLPLLLVAACQGVAAQPVCPPSPRVVITDGLVDVGGLALHVHCVGEGKPIVVLDAGLGGDGASWKDVQPEIGRFTRACAYDRAGLGYSGPAPRSHTSQQMARELHTLLDRAGLDGPYVLVGHSFGGLNVRMFASEYPRDVSGMVLVDASTEDQDTRYWSALPEGELSKFKAGVGDTTEGVDFDAWVASMALLRNANRSLGDKPLVVLTRGRMDPEPGMAEEVRVKLWRAWQEVQAELPRLSSNSVQVVATNSGHMIPQEAPRMFVAAVRTAVDAARAHAPLDRGALDALARQAASLSTDEAVTRLFTQPMAKDWFAASLLSQVSTDQLKAVFDQLATDLGRFKRVARDGDHLTIEFEHGSLPTDAALNEDGRLVTLLFRPPVRTPEPPRSPTEARKPPSVAR